MSVYYKTRLSEFLNGDIVSKYMKTATMEIDIEIQKNLVTLSSPFGTCGLY
ncbi:MAG: hypothetical protein ACPKPY_03305 [Nitrososphaeraceae archaeon]